jgi:hypothetical protein
MAQNFRRTQFLRTTIVEAYTKRRLPHDLVIRHPQAAIQTSGDLRLVVTLAYRVFALPVRYACDGC